MRRQLLVVLPLGLLAMGLGAKALADRSWTAFVEYKTPFGSPPEAPSAEGREAAVPRVVVFLVDGLRLDASRRMTFLNELRHKGADLESTIGLPSFSLPARSTLLSGAWHDVHGQTTNMKPRSLAVEHLFRTAKSSGIPAAYVAGPAPFELFDPWVGHRYEYPEVHVGADLAALEAELAAHVRGTETALAEVPSGLLVAELVAADEAGHEWGGGSSQYVRLVEKTDEALRGLASRVDLGRDTVIVTSDHGHTDRGGHGGSEALVTRVPLVLAGARVAAGSGTARHIDVAPTIAALLGLPIPRQNQGRILFEHLRLDPETAKEAQSALDGQRRAFVSRYTHLLTGQALVAPAVQKTGGSSPADDWDAAEETVRKARLESERERRTREAVALLVVLGLVPLVLEALGIASLKDTGRAAALAALAYAAYRLTFPLVGLGTSMSVLNRDEELQPFFRTDMMLAVAACALAVTLGGALERRRRPEASLLDLARSSWLTAGALLAIFFCRLLYEYRETGAFLTWHMPSVDALFMFYLDLLATLALGFAGPVQPLAAWAGAALATMAAKRGRSA